MSSETIRARHTPGSALRLARKCCTAVMISGKPPLFPSLSLSAKTSITPVSKKMPMKLYQDNAEDKKIENKEKKKKLSKEEWRKLEWSFIKEMYGGFLAIELLLAAMVYSAVLLCSRYQAFFSQHPFLLAALWLFFCISAIPIGFFYKKEDSLLILLFSMLYGTSCFIYGGRVMAQSAMVTAAVVSTIRWCSFQAIAESQVRIEPIAYLGLSFLKTNISRFQKFYPGAPVFAVVSRLIGFLTDSTLISWLTTAYINWHDEDNKVYFIVLLHMVIFRLFCRIRDCLYNGKL